jgi:hypothetical protein
MKRDEPAAPLTAAEGHKFAFTLAAAFGVLAAIALLRHRQHSGYVFGAIALVCVLAGILAPTRLGPVSRAWNRLGEALSRVTSPVVFTVVYLVVLTPIGVVRRSVGRSPLARASDDSTYWITRDAASPDETRRRMEHLF